MIGASTLALNGRVATLIAVVCLCSCGSGPKAPESAIPLTAHLVPADGTSVPDAPEPEVVQLTRIETVGIEKHVTVGNAAGEYVLICLEDVNDEEKHTIPSCLSPRPSQNYLLFRANTKWLVNGAKAPIDLAFMQDWSVKYNRGENVGLMPAKKSDGEAFGVYWLSSWTEKKAAAR
jgi:hypothetical protein